MERSYKVIVIGAGPAGATLAYELANKGIEVLLLEKETLPRYKCCAGGVTVKAAGILGADINELVEDTVSSATVTFRGNNPYHGHYGQALMYTVMRDKFDNALVRRAEEAGAVIAQRQNVRKIRDGARWVEVSTSAGDFRSQFVVGADGAYSIVARELGLRSNAAYLAAIGTEVLVPEEELVRWRSQIAIDLGYVPGGLAWMFPKLDHLSIGVACLSSKAKGLKRRYQEFLDSFNMGHYTVTRRGGSLIPVCRGDALVTRARAALLGDAAGFVDPLTGEGIYNAILSAQLAAPVIEESLLCDKAELHDYQQAVAEKILPEMKIAYALSEIFVRFPSVVFEMFHRDERIWRGCCYLLRGELTYSTIKQKLSAFGPLHALLKAWL